MLRTPLQSFQSTSGDHQLEPLIDSWTVSWKRIKTTSMHRCIHFFLSQINKQHFLVAGHLFLLHLLILLSLPPVQLQSHHPSFALAHRGEVWDAHCTDLNNQWGWILPHVEPVYGEIQICCWQIYSGCIKCSCSTGGCSIGEHWRTPRTLTQRAYLCWTQRSLAKNSRSHLYVQWKPVSTVPNIVLVKMTLQEFTKRVPLLKS